VRSYKFWLFVLIAAVTGLLALAAAKGILFTLSVFLSFADVVILRAVLNSWLGPVIVSSGLAFVFLKVFLLTYSFLVRRFW
jgi:hypothetical protein